MISAPVAGSMPVPLRRPKLAVERKPGMTIAIGLSCNNGESILLAADTLISYGTVSSNQGGSKLYESKTGLYITVADEVSWAQVVVTNFIEKVKKLDPSQDSYPENVKAELQKSSDEAFMLWRHEHLKSVNLTVDEYLHNNQLSKRKRQDAEYALRLAREQGLPIQVIVVGFVKKNEQSTHRIMLYADGLMILDQMTLGAFYAGSGTDPARDWLNYRQQNVSTPWEDSYYHLIEALNFAELSRSVGSKKSVIYLDAYTDFYIPLLRVPNSESDKLLAKLYEDHWAKKTDFSDDIRREICRTTGISYRHRTF